MTDPKPSVREEIEREHELCSHACGAAFSIAAIHGFPLKADNPATGSLTRLYEIALRLAQQVEALQSQRDAYKESAAQYAIMGSRLEKQVEALQAALAVHHERDFTQANDGRCYHCGEKP